MFRETIAVYDEEPIAIQGLRSLIESVHGLRLVAAETCLPRAMHAVHKFKPTLFLIGTCSRIQEVMKSLKDLRHSEPPTHVIIWSASDSREETLDLLHAGAAGVIRKTAPLAMLMTCLHEVASGKTWTEDEITNGVGGRPLRPTPSALTPREQQVIELVERGLKIRDIATELGICIGTVNMHRKNIFEKTGIRSRRGAFPRT
jgi:two-component system nitrate/nitrite response regulator NarL